MVQFAIPKMRLIVALAIALVGMLGAQPATDGQMRSLYFLAATPTPLQDAEYAAELYRLDPGAELRLVREIAPASGGVNTVDVSAERRLISIATPRVNPHKFFIIRMDEPELNDTKIIDYAGSGLNPHLLDLPGHRIMQSLINVVSPPNGGPVEVARGVPAPRELPRGATGNNDDSRRMRIIGIDLSPGAGSEAQDLAASWYKYVTFQGSASGVSRSGYLAGQGAADGRSLEVRLTNSPAPLDVTLPIGLVAGSNDLVEYQAITDSLIVVNIKPTRKNLRNPGGVTQLHVYDRSSGAWADLPVAGDSTSIRVFGKWICGEVAEDNSGNPKRMSPGTESERAARGTGKSAEVRFALLRRYFSGDLFLYNADTRKQYTIHTAQGDSEILLVSADSVYYRVNDSLYMSRLSGGKVENPTMLSAGGSVRDIHWAFEAQ